MLGYPWQGTQLVHIWAGEPYASHSENVENINLAEDTLKKKKKKEYSSEMLGLCLVNYL